MRKAAVLFPVVHRGAHRPSSLRDGRPTTVLETQCQTPPGRRRCQTSPGRCRCLTPPGRRRCQTPPRPAAVPNVCLVFSARRRLQLDSAHRRHQCLSLHRENRRCRVTRCLDFFELKKRRWCQGGFPQTHFIVCSKTMLLSRFIDSVVNVPDCPSETGTQCKRAEHGEVSSPIVLAQGCGYVHQP